MLLRDFTNKMKDNTTFPKKNKKEVHGKCFDHKDYKDWKLRDPCRGKSALSMAARIAKKPRDNYRSCNVASNKDSVNCLIHQKC